jgi:2-methylcitrate dehydratase PrpD
MGPALRHAARVTVRTTDGRALSREVLNRRGSPENAVTREDVERKFAANLTGILAPPEIDRLKSLALSIDTLPNADEIVKIVSPARSQGGSLAHRL